MNDLDNRPLPPDGQGEELEVKTEYPTDWMAGASDVPATTPAEIAADKIMPQGAQFIDSPPPEAGASLWQRLLPLAIAGMVLFLDQFTKYLVETRVPLYQSWAPFPSLEAFFRITHATNTGAAFGLFQGGGWFFGIMAAVVASAIIYYSLTLPRGHNLLRLALGLQLGGALGNLLDRIQNGHVTDFLDFGPWPIFNLADMAVVSGVVLLAWIMLREESEARRAHKRESESDYPSSPHLWHEPSNEKNITNG
jgi:signal peptidase II